MVAIGTWIWLASDLMFFAALFAAYFNLRSLTNAAAAQAGTESLWQWGAAHFNMPFAVTNTLILILSSVTCQMGVWKAERGQVGRTGSLLQVGQWGLREWYILTFIMGAIFIGDSDDFAHGLNERISVGSFYAALTHWDVLIHELAGR